MGTCCCVTQVQDNIKDSEDDVDYLRYLVSLPTELLVKILSYLPTYDKIMIRCVSRRFRDVGEAPMLWKEFDWRYKPHHVHTVSKVLKVYGKHVRSMYFPHHVIPTKILEMARCCTNVTHLSLPRCTQLSLDHLKEIMHTMTSLEYLDVFTDHQADHSFIHADQSSVHSDKFVDKLLNIVASKVKELKLQIYYRCLPWVIASIQKWANRGYALPSIINIFCDSRLIKYERWLEFWSTSSSRVSFEIGLYNNRRIPMNLYPSVPLGKFQFSLTATPPFIQLSNHGIVGLKHDVFHICDYHHYGTVRHVITPEHHLYQSLNEEKHFNYSNCLHSVSYLDISDSNVHSNHLEQLAAVCDWSS